MNPSPKNAVVTGGTDGIGKEIARGLARAGHRLILVGRDSQKGARAAEELLGIPDNAGVRFIQADLSSVSEVQRLGKEVVRHFPLVHRLVHCAGVIRGRRELTPEGVESNFAVNFLSRFALTLRLLPALETAGQPGEAARIVIIGGAARNGRVHFDDVNLSRHFGMLRVVSQFCQANDLFTIELARRLACNGNDHRVTVNCLKIGVVKTNIRREFPQWMKWLVPLVMDPLLGQTPQEAAEPALRLLLSEEFEGMTGALFLKIKEFRRIAAGSAQDPLQGSRLWDLGERLTDGVPKNPNHPVSMVRG